VKTRSWWGWGYEDEALGPDARQRLAALLATQMDVAALQPLEPPPIDSLALRAPRVAVPEGITQVSAAAADRAAHTYGKAFRDVVRALEGDLKAAPDAVAFPADEHELERLLDWAGGARVALVPYGGGSSVVGGVEARIEGSFAGAVSVDLRRLSGVREVDVRSRAALVDAGTFGPDLEAALGRHGLSLRHYPQSFQHSTVGGWLATRAGGHFATLNTHIDDLCESLAVLTPTGLCETRRLPASGAGPQPERLFLGSEGTLGVIVRAWLRVFERPRFRASASVRFETFQRAVEATRALGQSGLHPSNCRLLDAAEALLNGVGDGTSSYLLVAFESADHPLDPWLARALELCRDHGGERAGRDETASVPLDLDGPTTPGEPAERWRRAFLRGPYLRDAVVRLGAITETFETAVTWDRFEAFHRTLIDTARSAVARICGGGLLTSRVTHVYPDGAAPYFTVVAPARPGGQVQQWDAIKAAVSEAIVASGGTITHHHAVGRDHRPWYDRERPEPFARAIAAAKRALDPAGIMNPGVLVG
jgi:alkyldihydroxyacetonephosphate synthase